MYIYSLPFFTPTRVARQRGGVVKWLTNHQTWGNFTQGAKQTQVDTRSYRDTMQAPAGSLSNYQEANRVYENDKGGCKTTVMR